MELPAFTEDSMTADELGGGLPDGDGNDDD